MQNMDSTIQELNNKIICQKLKELDSKYERQSISTDWSRLEPENRSNNISICTASTGVSGINGSYYPVIIKKRINTTV